MAYQNLVSNAIMKVLLKVKHINKYAYKKKMNKRLNLRTEATHLMHTCVSYCNNDSKRMHL